jgi:hypothetical protein
MRIGPVAGSIEYMKSKGGNRTDGYGAGCQKGCSKVRTSEHFFLESLTWRHWLCFYSGRSA